MKTWGGIITLGLLVAGNAAAQVSVTPVQVQLTPQATSSLVAVTNDSSVPMRFQVSAKTWSQLPDGEMSLEDTQDIAFYPAIFEIPAHTTRRVRVGAITAIGRGERTYRLFVEQLPSFDGQQVGITVLTRLSLPVFVGEQATPATPTIADARLSGGALQLRVVNAGETHFTIRNVRVSGRSADGKARFEKSATGWYVLNRGERIYSMPVDGCAGLSGLDVEVETDVARLATKLPVSTTDCGP